MTDEQIKQNAEVYCDENFSPLDVDRRQYAEEDFIAGYHSRDEEVEDLEQALACAEDVVDIQRKELDQLRNPWISVEERLPDEGQAVIVRLAFGAGNHAACNYSNGQFVWALCIETSNVNIQSKLKLPAITHWMPIPQIKKGE